MLDDDDATLTLAAPRSPPAGGESPHGRSATIIPFRGRTSLDAFKSANPNGRSDAVERSLTDVMDRITIVLDPRSMAHAPTLLACLGALTGFAAQQNLLHEGGSVWAQPNRAAHLDRLLLGSEAGDDSLWNRLKVTAHGLGAQHLPNPNTLLDATLRCVGTTQFGLITLPLEYKLKQQPLALLSELWSPLTRGLGPQHGGQSLCNVFALACTRSVASEVRAVPPHVALRIVMQAALAMALIEPRGVPGATTKPQSG